uniref:Uncharacterized protein n=1 Tax=Cacopsylla melanoneura TaxID=428564 RepID=A0A8D8U1S0_9HEMI
MFMGRKRKLGSSLHQSNLLLSKSSVLLESFFHFDDGVLMSICICIQVSIVSTGHFINSLVHFHENLELWTCHQNQTNPITLYYYNIQCYITYLCFPYTYPTCLCT